MNRKRTGRSSQDDRPISCTAEPSSRLIAPPVRRPDLVRCEFGILFRTLLRFSSQS